MGWGGWLVGWLRLGMVGGVGVGAGGWSWGWCMGLGLGVFVGLGGGGVQGLVFWWMDVCGAGFKGWVLEGSIRDLLGGVLVHEGE